MSRICLLLLALAASCAFEPSPTPSAAHQRQAMHLPTVLPIASGRISGAKLGSSLAACRLEAFVAGAPGDNSVLFISDGGSSWMNSPIAGVDAGSFAVAVACAGAIATPRVYTGGDLGTYASIVGGNPTIFGSAAVEAVEPGPLSNSPILLGSPNTGTVRVLLQNGTFLADLVADAGAGAALVWDRAGTFFAVGDPASSSVRTYGWSPADGGVTPDARLVGPADSGFGAALAVGDVHPNPGLELIIGAPRSAQVFIYGLELMQPVKLMVLEADLPISDSFGISLAVEPNVAAGLGAVWVGDPLNERVIRFVGDAGEPVSANLTGVGGYFGFSLAIQPRTLMVGAPLYGGPYPQVGAVYAVPLDWVALNGSPMNCDVMRSCTTASCENGSCLGGVACVPDGRLLCDPSSCSNGTCTLPMDGGSSIDAGSATDAGNAGTTNDAGITKDAGTEPDRVDAGTAPDAGASLDGGVGVVTFGTCGCSGLGALPMVLLSMLLGRRRRSSQGALPAEPL